MVMKTLEEFFKKDFIIGLDIGTSSIKIAQFIKGQGGLRLLRADLKEIASSPSAPRNDGQKKIVSTLKDLFKGINVKKSTVIASINCPMTAIKKAVVPHMPKAELRRAIALEAKSYFPFPVSGALLDFEIIGDVEEKGVKKYEIMVTTSPRETVDKYLSILNEAGIKPASLIPCTYALQNLHAGEGRVNCFVDIGERYTESVIFKGRELVFSRKIPVAGGDFTKAMTGVLVSDKGRIELSLEEAEKIKREVGIPQQGEPGMIDDKISTVQILSMQRPLLEQLAKEIDRCLDYYRDSAEGGKIDSVVLFGGGAMLRGLPEFLSAELEMEVKVGNSLDGIEIKSGAMSEAVSRQAASLSSAVGAALSEAKGLNLLPPEIKEETKRTFKRAGLQSTAAALILILVFVYIGMRIQLGNYQKRLSVGKLELSSLRLAEAKLEKRNLINQILSDEPYWEEILKDLSHAIPRNIYLTELSMLDNLIKMKGIILSGDGEEALSAFILKLEEGIFKNVKLVTSRELEGQAATEFELACKPN